MDELSIYRSISSSRRDSEFFMQTCEDIDDDECEELSFDKNRIYGFQVNSNWLITNKGNTHRSDWPILNCSKLNSKKSVEELPECWFKSSVNLSFEHPQNSFQGKPIRNSNEGVEIRPLKLGDKWVSLSTPMSQFEKKVHSTTCVSSNQSPA